MSIKTTTCLIGVALLAASPAALADRSLPFDTELDSCISAIQQRIDLGDATRVRHIVLETENTLTGYELTIDTIVFAEGRQREYRAVCATRGALAPSKLEIRGR